MSNYDIRGTKVPDDRRSHCRPALASQAAGTLTVGRYSVRDSTDRDPAGGPAAGHG